MHDAARSVTSATNYVDDMVPTFKAVMRSNSLRRQLEHYLTQQGEIQVIEPSLSKPLQLTVNVLIFGYMNFF